MVDADRHGTQPALGHVSEEKDGGRRSPDVDHQDEKQAQDARERPDPDVSPTPAAPTSTPRIL